MNLSIIIPVYNCAPYLIEGFKHIQPLYKTDLTFEIIYVNDGSTDLSLEVLKELQATNAYITVLSQENQGSSGARNTAIDIAKGEYIQFLDADDIIDIEQIVEMLSFSQKKQLDLLGYRLDYIDSSYNQIAVREKQQVIHDAIFTGSEILIQGYQPSSICVFLFRTDFLQTNQLRITPKITHMDVEFMTRVMLKAQKVLFKDVIAYHYLQREGSITKPTSEQKKEQLLKDEITIAHLIRKNINPNMDKVLITTLEKNYNSVVWNLLWKFVTRNEPSKKFKIDCIKTLKHQNLYPIKGSLKTPFQNTTRILFNITPLLKLLIK